MDTIFDVLSKTVATYIDKDTLADSTSQLMTLTFEQKRSKGLWLFESKQRASKRKGTYPQKPSQREREPTPRNQVKEKGNLPPETKSKRKVTYPREPKRKGTYPQNPQKPRKGTYPQKPSQIK